MPMVDRMVVYGRMIKFSHTVFALPFALSAVVLAQRSYPFDMRQLFWILLAMVGARSAAMGFNRIVDARFDAQNPRTEFREIPSGKLSLKSAGLFVVLSSVLFIVSAAMLGKWCFYLSFPTLAFILSYSYTKRFTWMAHIFLGMAIGLSPAGAWLAVANSLSWPVFILSAALMTHIAGFDIIYACQDMAFDQQKQLFSIPARFGVRFALLISTILHVLSFFALVAIYFVFDMTLLYLMTVCFIGILFLLEHLIVKPDDLEKVNIAFFHINSAISVVLFIGILLDELFRRWVS